MWSTEYNKAFELAKEKLVSADVLVHYNLTLPVKLAGDASTYDGTERPVAFASKTLSISECNYSQIEKERGWP